MSVPTDKKEGREYIQVFGKWAVTILLVCLFLATSFLAIDGIRYSYGSPIGGGNIYELADSTGKHILLFAGVCAGLTGVYVLLKRLEKYQERIAAVSLILAAVWLLIVGFGYVNGHLYYPEGDQLNTTAGAMYARQENFVMFKPGGYIGMYQQQKGLLFVYEILFTLCGDLCYDVAAGIHVVLSVVTLFAGYGFLKCVAKNPFYRILYCVLMMFCMPHMIYLPYAYGDLPSICFSMVLFWALAKYGEARQKRYVIISAVAAALSLMLRMNIWIVLIAVAIGMVLLAAEKKSPGPLLVGLCVILAAWGSVKAIDILYEQRSGYESGIGIPGILWIAMGLQETDGAPGVYNRYQQTVFENCGFEQEPAQEIGKQYIQERLKEMWNNPGYTKDFFVRKVRMQWQEPLFESMLATDNFKEGETVPEWLNDLYYGKLHDVVWKFANYYQSIVYMALFVLVVLSFRMRNNCWQNNAGWIPLIAFVGGFLFSIIWESQCRYVLPYYVYMIMYASVGLGRIAEIISGIAKRLAGEWLKKDVADATDIAA